MTLHQISRPTSHWHNDFLANIQALWQNGDQIILLGEAAQGFMDQRLQAFYPLFLLLADAAVLGLNPEKQHLSHLKLIDYNEWASLIVNQQKQITWA